MKDLYFLNKDYFKKKDIFNELSNIETDYYTIHQAFVLGGMVHIRGRFKPDIAGNKNYKLLPTRYAPEDIAIGNMSFSYSMDNITRIGFVTIGIDGKIDVWINNVIGGENFIIQYPLKVE